MCLTEASPKGHAVFEGFYQQPEYPLTGLGVLTFRALGVCRRKSPNKYFRNSCHGCRAHEAVNGSAEQALHQVEPVTWTMALTCSILIDAPRATLPERAMSVKSCRSRYQSSGSLKSIAASNGFSSEPNPRSCTGQGPCSGSALPCILRVSARLHGDVATEACNAVCHPEM